VEARFPRPHWENETMPVTQLLAGPPPPEPALLACSPGPSVDRDRRRQPTAVPGLAGPVPAVSRTLEELTALEPAAIRCA
jgi:hypothetical protein